MARPRIRNDSWKEDLGLQEYLRKRVHAGLHRQEILDYMVRDYPQYAWSLRSLDRRLAHFRIKHTNYAIPIDQVKEVVKLELDGPGKLLGYRALHQKIRQVHNMNVPRDLVYDIMSDVDPDGLRERALGNKKRKKGHFTTRGVNWVYSLDGHDKLMGFAKNTFPLAVYGCADTASRKILWIKVWMSNNNPDLIGRWYLDYTFQSKKVASKLRVDKGTETGTMVTMHSFLRRNHEDMEYYTIDKICDETVMFGPSTANQIERWWKELHHRLEKYFKPSLKWLLDNFHYDPNNQNDRNLLAYLMVPILQKEIDLFKDVVWNNHRIRFQNDTYLPDGVPNHIYDFPQEYGLEDCGWKVTDEQLEEVANASGVLSVGDDYLDEDFRQKCSQIITNPLEVKPDECTDAFLYLKDRFEQMN